MKNAAKILWAVVVAFALMGTGQSYAQTVGSDSSALLSPTDMPAVPASATVTPAAPIIAPSAPQTVGATTVTPVSPVTATVPASNSSPAGIVVPQPQLGASPILPPSPFGDASDSRSRSLGSSSSKDPKVPDSVKNAISRLSSGNSEASLEDINSAREAIAKLDVLIDIEKRLNDLSTLRQERTDKTSVPQISASAILPKNVVGGNNSGIVAPPMLPVGGHSVGSSGSSSVAKTFSSVDIDRVYGAVGNYRALVRVAEGKPVTVREGDKLSDGSTVKSITNRSVKIVREGKEKTIAVKNVETLSGKR